LLAVLTFDAPVVRLSREGKRHLDALEVGARALFHKGSQEGTQTD
jgi:hypothetical protein